MGSQVSSYAQTAIRGPTAIYNICCHLSAFGAAKSWKGLISDNPILKREVGLLKMYDFQCKENKLMRTEPNFYLDVSHAVQKFFYFDLVVEKCNQFDCEVMVFTREIIESLGIQDLISDRFNAVAVQNIIKEKKTQKEDLTQYGRDLIFSTLNNIFADNLEVVWARYSKANSYEKDIIKNVLRTCSLSGIYFNLSSRKDTAYFLCIEQVQFKRKLKNNLRALIEEKDIFDPDEGTFALISEEFRKKQIKSTASRFYNFKSDELPAVAKIMKMAQLDPYFKIFSKNNKKLKKQLKQVKPADGLETPIIKSFEKLKKSISEPAILSNFRAEFEDDAEYKIAQLCILVTSRLGVVYPIVHFHGKDNVDEEQLKETHVKRMIELKESNNYKEYENNKFLHLELVGKTVEFMFENNFDNPGRFKNKEYFRAQSRQSVIDFLCLMGNHRDEISKLNERKLKSLVTKLNSAILEYENSLPLDLKFENRRTSVKRIYNVKSYEGITKKKSDRIQDQQRNLSTKSVKINPNACVCGTEPAGKDHCLADCLSFQAYLKEAGIHPGALTPLDVDEISRMGALIHLKYAENEIILTSLDLLEKTNVIILGTKKLVFNVSETFTLAGLSEKNEFVNISTLKEKLDKSLMDSIDAFFVVATENHFRCIFAYGCVSCFVLYDSKGRRPKVSVFNDSTRLINHLEFKEDISFAEIKVEITPLDFVAVEELDTEEYEDDFDEIDPETFEDLGIFPHEEFNKVRVGSDFQIEQRGHADDSQERMIDLPDPEFDPEYVPNENDDQRDYNESAGEEDEFENPTIEEINQNFEELSSKNTFICLFPRCNSFLKKKPMIKHYKNDHQLEIPLEPRTFKCNECNITFQNKSRFDSHSRSEHPNRCKHCMADFGTSADMMKHITEMHKPQKGVCTFCGKKVKNLKEHMLTHSNTVHTCSFCSKVFKSTDGLRDHQRQHHNAMRLKCNYCNQSDFAQDTLKWHRRERKCITCKLVLRCPKKLNNHVLLEHSVSCGIGNCNAKFRYPKMLDSHKRAVHERIKCDVPNCDKFYNGSSHRWLHLKIFHKEISIRCEICNIWTVEPLLQLHREKHNICFICRGRKTSYSEARECTAKHIAENPESIECDLCKRAINPSHLCARHFGSPDGDQELYNRINELVTHDEGTCYFKEEIGLPEISHYSVSGNAKNNLDSPESEKYTVGPDIILLGHWRFAKRCPQTNTASYVFNTYKLNETEYSRTPKDYWQSTYTLNSKTRNKYGNKIRAPKGYDMGHQSPSFMSKNQIDRVAANHEANLLFQESEFNRRRWYQLEKFQLDYLKNNNFVQLNCVTMPMYLNLETQDSAGPSNNNIIFIDGKPIPRFLIKILFFINDDGTFVNRNFIMANTTNAASKEFFDCETTLLQIEDYFPTMRFLTKKTRTADVFINMNEQNSLEIPKREVNIQTFGDTAANFNSFYDEFLKNKPK